MAIVYIRDIQSRLDKTISYISNRSKTANKSYERAFLDLHNALNYTTDDVKTEQQFYVSALNCKPETAYKDMIKTKNAFKKTDKILGYHLIQSFDRGEGTPEMIHELGKKFAEEIWGDRFEVVVSTHLNTSSLHNHYVINSVSLKDGKKYYDNYETYARLREVSDRLCREYGLSVIENPSRSSHKNYALYMAKKNGEWTKDAIIKRDIDECILISISPKGFYREMQKRGYYFNFNRKYPTISHPNFERPRRMKTLGWEYTPEQISERIMRSFQKYEVEIPEQDNLVDEYLVPLNEPTYTEMYVSFLTVVEYVKKHPNTNRNIDKYLIEEMQKLDKLIEQQNLLCDNDIETPEQLEQFKNENKEELNEVVKARDNLRILLKRAMRKGDEKEIIELKNDISLLSERAKILRKNLRVIERVEETQPKIENKINQLKNDNKRKELSKDERFRRRSRTNSENEFTRS